MTPDPHNPQFQQFLKEIDDHFVHVLRDLLGWQITGNPEFSVGSGNVVIRFEKTDGKRFLFRVPRFSQDQLRRVALAYRYFGAAGMMPAQVYMDGKCVLEAYAEGMPLAANTSDAALGVLVRTLKQVHAMPASGYGPLSHGTTGLYADAQTYYSAHPMDIVHADDSVDMSDQQMAQIETLEHAARTMPDAVRAAPVCVGHGDLWRNNVVIDTHDGVTLLDWDRIGSYPREYDFVFMLDADLDARQKQLVLDTYGLPLEPSRLAWFALRRLMGNRGRSARDKLSVARRHGLLR